MIVNNHEIEWFQEDHDKDFENEFRSNFASSMRRDSLPAPPQNKLAALHNEQVKKLNDKYDALVIKTTRMMNQAEISKNHLRKTARSLQTQLEETQENWQASASLDNEEITTLKEKVADQKIKIEELEKKMLSLQ